MGGLREVDPQLQLFARLAIHSAAQQRRQLAVTRSRSKRDIAVAIGQVGNQLALALWRADELASAVRSTRLCPACSTALQPALERFDEFPGGRHPPPLRYLPVIGTAG